MKFNKKLLFKIHGWIGVKLSILFFIVCLSGTFATLSNEMDWLVNPAIRAVPQETLASKNLMRDNLRAAFPESKFTYWSGAREPYLCDVVFMVHADESRSYVFVNPYTGAVQGSANLTMQRYFRDLHYYLFIPFQVGHFTVLIFGFLLLFSLLTALLFMKKWYRKFLELKRGKGPLVLFRSLHRLVGLWAIPFMLLFSVTGIWYFLERTNTAGISKTANTKTPKLEEPMTDSVALAELYWHFDYDRAADSARAHIPGLLTKDISLPRKLDAPVYLTGISNVPLVRNRANRVYLHPENYTVIKVQNAAALPTVTWLNDIADPLHFGSFGGLPTKIIWFFAGLAISGLVLTGIWISLKRKVRTEKLRRAQRMGRWKYVNWALVGLLFLFMYGTLSQRYQASWPVLITITAGWLILGFGAWYLFVYRLREVALEAQTQVQKKLVKRKVRTDGPPGGNP